MTEYPIKRRNLLRATGATLLGTVGASQASTAQETSGGDLVWAFTQPSGPVESSPTVADGTVYVGSNDETLYAVDAATGSQEWAFTQPSASIRSSPTVGDGTVYVGSWDETLYAVDAATGSQEWAFNPSGRVESSPTVVDGTVYVGSRDETLYAVDADSGNQEWAFTQLSGRVSSSPTVADGTVYVGSGGFGDGDGTLYAVDAGVEGSSEGSRVNLGTPGDLSTGGGDSSGLIDRAGPAGLLVAAILTLGGYGYYRLRRSGDGQGQTSQRAGGRRD